MTMRKLRKDLTAGLLVAAFVISLVFPATVQAAQAVSEPTTSAAPRYVDYALASLNSSDPLTQRTLASFTGGNMTLSGFEDFIRSQYLPYGIRQVLLDIGWQNYSVNSIPYETWVNTWLEASDAMGIQNVIYTGQLTSAGVRSGWISSLLQLDPSAQTYYANGTAAAFVSYDDPDVALFLERDLSTIYSYYGNHTSWVGIGTGTPGNDPYQSSTQFMPLMGYSNTTVSDFVDTVYYARDINASGYLSTGTLDALWSSLKAIPPSIVLSSGLWMTSSSVNVYGAGGEASFVEMRFYLPRNESNLQLGWYGDKVGSPGPLQIQVLGDQRGRASSVVYGNTTVDGAGVGSTSGWQMSASLTDNFSAGYHWALFSSPRSDNSSYYEIYMNNFRVGNNTALAQEAYIGPGLRQGSSVLWVKDSLGTDLAVYPFVQTDASPLTTQTFVALRSYTFNTVFLFLNYRAFNPTNGTLTVSDLTAGDTTLATGVLSQSLIQGLQNWTPINLNGSVTTIPGHTYLLTVSEPKAGYSWRIVMRGLFTDPPTSGFQNQSRYWLFELGNIVWGQGQYGFSGLTTNGDDAVTSGYVNALRVIPSANESFTSVQILMMNNIQSANYTSGAFSAGIWAGNASQPIGPPLQQVSIPATKVPADGFLNFSGFNAGVFAGRDYWIVFSANSTEHFTIGRLVGGYEYLVKVSPNNGVNWYEPRDGPTEFAFVASFSNQVLGNCIEGFPSVELTPNSDFAQSFVASSDTQVDGVFLGPLGQGPEIRVSINPDTGQGEPSLAPMASGIYDAANITSASGLQFVQFSSVANLQQGQKYWLEVTPIGSNYGLSLIEYLPLAPGVPKNTPALLSSNDGLTWAKVSNDTSLVLYSLVSPATSLPSLSASAIVSDLALYHSFSVQNGILRGWNAFLEASRLDLYGQIISWLNNATGKQFQFFASADANVVVQLKPVDLTALSESEQNTNCAGAIDNLISQMPFSGRQFFSEDGMSSLGCAVTLRPLAAQLSQMIYVGGSYGSSTGEQVLVVGDSQASNLSRTLSVAYNCTYTQLSLDAGLEDEANLTQYKVILWASEVEPFGSGNLTQRLLAYVARGGELIVILTDGKSSTVADLLYSLPVEGPTGRPGAGTAFLNASALHTGYANQLSISNISSSSTLAISAGLTLGVHSYGQGRFAFVDLSSPALSQISDLSTLLSNLISQSSGNSSPFWYGPPSPATQSPLLFTILGSTGEPVLVWFVNPSNSPASISLNLNNSYYNLSPSLKIIDLGKMSVNSSSGPVVQMHIVVAPDSWDPIFVVNSHSTWLSDYSNALLKEEFVYPNQSLHEFLGAVGQTTIAAFSSDSNVSEIVLNDEGRLPVLSNMSTLASASQGWYFDPGTNTLLVKYTATGLDAVRITLISTAKTQAPAVPVDLLAKILILFVAAEVSVLTFVTLVRPTKRK
jgi:hypothetical protein